MKWIYQMNRVRVSRGDKLILNDVTLTFLPGAKIGVVGPNGAGKSTVLKTMAGLEQPSNGEATLAPGVSVGILLQEPPLDETKTVLGNVEHGVAAAKAMLARFTAVTGQLTEEYSEELMAEMGQLQEQLDYLGGWDLDSRLEQAMDALRCPPGDADVGSLSGGERRRVALCALLLRQPDLLLLDEPTNHLGAESVEWLEKHLQQYPGTVIAVTHDRYFLDNVAGWILELDQGRGIPWEGNYSSWLEQKQERLRREEKSESQRQKTLERELEWIRMAPRSRHAKSKARINAYESLLSQESEARSRELEIYIPPGPRLGNVVIEANQVTKAYGDNLLVDDMTFALPPGGIVGVIGPNGAGKTTLFRMITGQEHADSGAIRLGETVRLGYVDQSRDTLAANKTIWEEISDGQDMIEL